MEFEIVEQPQDTDRGGDSRIIREKGALKNRSTADVEDYPERRDQALLIPEEEYC